MNTIVEDSLKQTQRPQSPVSKDDTRKVNFRLEENRLKSFALWPVRYMNSSRLSAAGFYYLGTQDMVRCFECQVLLYKWEENDDPWLDHVRYSARCRFVRGVPCGNVPLNANDAVMPLDDDEAEDKIHPQPAVTHEKDYDSSMSKFVNNDRRKMDFHLEENRLKSFALWPVRYMSSRRLSVSGFYYLGKQDMVCCFECQLIVRKWEENDDPWIDYVRYAPQCRFVRGIPCGNVSLNANDAVMPLDDDEAEDKIHLQPAVTYEEDYDECGLYDMSQLQKNLDDKCNPIVKVIFGPNEQPVEISLRELREAKHPRYANVATRLDTFKSWPMVGMQSKERFAQTEFYFTGSDDLTICYYCGISLRGWNPMDEPLREHAKWSATCNYIARISAQKINSSLVCIH